MGRTTFFSKDLKFLLRIHEVIEGPGARLIAAEFIGEKPKEFLDAKREREVKKAKEVLGFWS